MAYETLENPDSQLNNYSTWSKFSLKTLGSMEEVRQRWMKTEQSKPSPDIARIQWWQLEILTIIAIQTDIREKSGFPPVFTLKKEGFSTRANHVLWKSH